MSHGPGADMTASRSKKSAGLSGFVSFMKRKDAECAVREMDGFDWGGSTLRVGWSKAVPIAAKALYVGKVEMPRISSKTSHSFGSAHQPVEDLIHSHALVHVHVHDRMKGTTFVAMIVVTILETVIILARARLGEGVIVVILVIVLEAQAGHGIVIRALVLPGVCALTARVEVIRPTAVLVVLMNIGLALELTPRRRSS